MTPILIKFPETLLDRIDACRGPSTRSRFIRDATSMACSLDAAAGIRLDTLPIRLDDCGHERTTWVVTSSGMESVCYDCQETVEVRAGENVTVLR